MRFVTRFLILAALLVAGGAEAQTTTTTTSTTTTSTTTTLPSNILLIILDDVGTNAIGAYEESDMDVTPQIDTLATGGILFRNAWVSPMCSATRSNIYTGTYGFRNSTGKGFPTLLYGYVQLGEALPDYTTYVAGKYHVNYNGPIGEGFDEFKGTWLNIGDNPNNGYCDWEKATWAMDGTPSYSEDAQTCTVPCATDEPYWAPTVTVNDSLGWITDDQEPWLIIASFHAAHNPRNPPPDYLHSNQAIKDAYLECSDQEMAINGVGRQAILESTDTEIGRLLDGVDFDDTTVILVGDNGSDVFNMTNSEVRDGKGSIWEGGLNVPLLVKGSAVTESTPSEAAALVHGVDLFPTILDIAGAPARTLDGISLTPVFADDTATVRSIVYADAVFDKSYQDPSWHTVAVRDDTYKLIRWGCLTGGYDLYNLSTDEMETTDIYGTLPVVEESLKAGLKAITGDDYDCGLHANKWRGAGFSE